MSKYQEYQDALDILRNIEQSHNYKKIGSSLTPESNLLQELVDEKLAKPTKKEIKKEWENEGFEIVSFTKERIEIYKQWIERINHCSHHTFAEICIEKDFFYITGQFSNKYTQLLTKTLKWLGW